MTQLTIILCRREMLEVSNPPDARAVTRRSQVLSARAVWTRAQDLETWRCSGNWTRGFSQLRRCSCFLSPLQHQPMISTKEERKREEPLFVMGSYWCRSFLSNLLLFAVSCVQLCFSFNAIVAECWIQPSSIKDGGLKTTQTVVFLSMHRWLFRNALLSCQLEKKDWKFFVMCARTRTHVALK